MKRATITMTDDLEAAVAAFQRDQEVPPALTAVAQAALREYLTERGYLSPAARSGSRLRSVGAAHLMSASITTDISRADEAGGSR